MNMFRVTKMESGKPLCDIDDPRATECEVRPRFRDVQASSKGQSQFPSVHQAEATSEQIERKGIEDCLH